MILKPTFLLCTLTLTLAACSNGSSSGDAAPDDPTNTPNTESGDTELPNLTMIPPDDQVNPDGTPPIPGAEPPGTESPGSGQQEPTPDTPPVPPNEEDPPDNTATITIDSPDEQTEDCSVAALNQWVDDNMRDYYLYYDQVPVLDLNAYDSPEELIVDLRVDPPDEFSNVRDADRQAQQFDEGVQFGFGFRSSSDSDGQPRLALVLRDSPMDLAGAERGDILVSANGIPWTDLTDEQFEDIFRDADETVAVEFVLRGGDGTDRTINVAPAEFPLFAVQFFTVQEVDGVRIGYIFFLSFIEPARGELDEVMQDLASQDIDELVLDMRYNGGGRTSIAYKLASQIAGNNFAGQPLYQLLFNDKYADLNTEVPFFSELFTLDLPRVVVLAQRFTASSSEIVINGLRPHMLTQSADR